MVKWVDIQDVFFYWKAIKSFALKLVFCFIGLAPYLLALPRFEIFEIYRAWAEDNKIQRSDNLVIHHFAGCRIPSSEIMC